MGFMLKLRKCGPHCSLFQFLQFQFLFYGLFDGVKPYSFSCYVYCTPWGLKSSQRWFNFASKNNIFVILAPLPPSPTSSTCPTSPYPLPQLYTPSPIALPFSSSLYSCLPLCIFPIRGIPLVQGGLPPLLLHLLQLPNVSLKVAPNQFNSAEIFSHLPTNWGPQWGCSSTQTGAKTDNATKQRKSQKKTNFARKYHKLYI